MLKAHRYVTAGLLAAGLMMTTAAQSKAQERSFRYESADQRAYDNGYREGLLRGEQDVRARRSFSFANAPEYREADLGYRRGETDMSEYRRMFRSGFEAGYADAYDRTAREYGRVPRAAEPVAPGVPGYGYQNPAAQIGFRDGYEAGVRDARGREPFDPVRTDRYREADHQYDRKYGSRELFKRDYRAGFEQGYETGYRVGR